MALASNQVAITNAAGGTAIVAALTTNTGHDPGYGPTRCVFVSNAGGVTVYLGPSGVTSSNGLPLAASSTVTLWLYPDEALYGITSGAGPQTVSYLASGS